jgi:hypothetical protein
MCLRTIDNNLDDIKKPGILDFLLTYKLLQYYYIRDVFWLLNLKTNLTITFQATQFESNYTRDIEDIAAHRINIIIWSSTSILKFGKNINCQLTFTAKKIKSVRCSKCNFY